MIMARENLFMLHLFFHQIFTGVSRGEVLSKEKRKYVRWKKSTSAGVYIVLGRK